MPRQLITYVLLTVICCCSVPGIAQQLDKQRIDSLILKTNRGKMPGFAVRVLKNNEVIYEGQCGYANIAKRQPMSPSSVVNLASVTKQFTAYAIFLLEERGQLNTTDDIRKYLPELPDFGTPITLKQLLAHTSGLRDYPDFLSLMNQSTNHNLQYSELVQFLQTHRELNFKPGERFCYSNTGYMLLARVIEKVSGNSYCTFLKNEFFDPLDMDHTFVNEGILNEQSDGTTNYTLHRCKTKAKKSRAHRDVIGATGVFSNLEDMTKWNRLFYEHESGIKRSGIIAKMETAYVLNDGSSCHYGGGLLLKQYRGKKVIEHSGGWGEYLTQWRRFPTENITIIVVTNSQLDSPFELCDKLSNLLVSFNDSVLPESLDAPLKLSDFDGTYISEDNIIRHVVTDSTQSHLRIYNLTKSTYNNYSLNRIETLADQRTGLFFVDSVNNLLVLTIGNDGANQLIWNMGTYFQVKRTYSEVAPFVQVNRQFAGKYYVPEMQRTVRIRYSKIKKKLVFVLFPLVRYDLIPRGNSVYQIEGETYLLRFTDKGVLFGNDWIYNLQFTKNLTLELKRHSIGIVM
jgi:CubicO group peptidase (beta-lactamase class C family)